MYSGLVTVFLCLHTLVAKFRLQLGTEQRWVWL